MNQHFIPKFIIEGFVNEDDPGNRCVWVFRASHKRWSKRPTRKTAALQDFYSFVEENGLRDDTLERLMGDVERDAAPFIRGPITQGVQLAPPQPFDIIGTFCAFLICRNPATVQRTADALVREARQTIQEMISSEENFQRFRRELLDGTGVDFPNIVDADRPRLLREFAINASKAGRLGFAMLMLKILPDELAQMAVTFFHAEQELTFITSDLPYALLPKSGGTRGIEQLVVPFSARVAAVFDTAETPVYRHVTASASEVRQINAAILSVAREFLISMTPDNLRAEPLNRWAESSQDERVKIAREVVGA